MHVKAPRLRFETRVYSTCFPFPTAAGQLRKELTDGDIEVVVYGAAINVVARERQSRTGGEARDGAIMTTQDDFGSERVGGETNDWRDFFVREAAERVTEREMMGCDVNR